MEPDKHYLSLKKEFTHCLDRYMDPQDPTPKIELQREMRFISMKIRSALFTAPANELDDGIDLLRVALQKIPTPRLKTEEYGYYDMLEQTLKGLSKCRDKR